LETKPALQLTLFQRWALLHFHEYPNGKITGFDLLNECCITAIDDTFNRNTVVSGLNELAEMKLIEQRKPELDIEKTDDPDLKKTYHSTIDGIIYAKKMMKPIMGALNPEDFDRILQKMSGSQKSKVALEQIMHASVTKSQNGTIKSLAEFGLGNISSFTQLLDTAIHFFTRGLS
jgi:hypothetical protein